MLIPLANDRKMASQVTYYYSLGENIVHVHDYVLSRQHTWKRRKIPPGFTWTFWILYYRGVYLCLGTLSGAGDNLWVQSNVKWRLGCLQGGQYLGSGSFEFVLIFVLEDSSDSQSEGVQPASWSFFLRYGEITFSSSSRLSHFWITRCFSQCFISSPVHQDAGTVINMEMEPRQYFPQAEDSNWGLGSGFCSEKTKDQVETRVNQDGPRVVLGGLRWPWNPSRERVGCTRLRMQRFCPLELSPHP